MYAEPARAFIESRGGEVRTGALARVLTDGTRVTGVDVRGERIAASRVDLGRALVRHAHALR